MNPGLLLSTLTIEALKRWHSSGPRNRLIADMLFMIKYIEKSGSGTIKMIRVCRECGVPEPMVIEPDDGFMVTFRQDHGTGLKPVRKIPVRVHRSYHKC
ncbi:MAG: ATP-binding protein [Methanoregula sp.]|nr:ATP-binding protein [Methanoregula sp.]